MNNTTTNNIAPIGVFDSGMGGLTVLNALFDVLPNENYIYLGDTARLPYGTKSKDTVTQYARNASAHLIRQGVKLLVVACNTASSYALQTLQAEFYPIPVVGVIEPSVTRILSQVPDGPLAVIATEGTVISRSYTETILKHQPQRQVIEWPCSLLVALAEEGWHEGVLVEKILHTLLKPLWEKIPNHEHLGLLLGCTHFPIFKKALKKICEPHIVIVDSALSVAQHVSQLMTKHNLLNTFAKPGNVTYQVTDGTERFSRVGKYFLTQPHERIEPELVTFDLFYAAKAKDETISTQDHPN